jgi:hypothetical protein
MLVGNAGTDSHIPAMPLAPVTRARLQASLAVAGTLTIWLWRGGTIPAALAGAAASLAVVAWVSPSHYAPVQRALDRGVHLLLTAITWLLLGLVYFLVFAPLRAVRSLAGRDPLQRKADPAATTYLRPLPPGPGRFDRQF